MLSMFAMEVSIPVRGSERAIRLPAGVLDLTDEELFEFCQSNRDLRIERSAKGDIIVMSPAGGYSGYQGMQVARQLGTWAEADKTGAAFDCSTGFRLANGAMRSTRCCLGRALAPEEANPPGEGAVHSSLPGFCD
jgi:Uma2 family endonuclease